MPNRNRLADRRPAHTFRIEFTNSTGKVFKYFATMSLFADGSVAEAFLDSNKAANDVQAMCSDMAVCFSIAMQYGVPFEAMRASISRNHDGLPQSLFGALFDAIHEELKDPELVHRLRYRYVNFEELKNGRQTEGSVGSEVAGEGAGAGADDGDRSANALKAVGYDSELWRSDTFE